MHMDAMMQTSKQKVEKFFVFFITNLGMLHNAIHRILYIFIKSDI